MMMYDEDYYEQFEPMPEQLEKVNEIISDYAKTKGKELVEQIELLEANNKRKEEKINELRDYKIKCSKLEKDLQSKYEKYSQKNAQEYLSKKVGLGGVIYGDTVYIVKNRRHKKSCEKCNGEKDITVFHGAEEMKIKCPKCSGKSHYDEHTYHVKSVKVIGFECKGKQNSDDYTYILDVTLTLSDGTKDRHGYVNARNYSPKNLNSENYYSGWYKTPEDAIKFCKEKISLEDA